MRDGKLVLTSACRQIGGEAAHTALIPPYLFFYFTAIKPQRSILFHRSLSLEIKFKIKYVTPSEVFYLMIFFK